MAEAYLAEIRVFPYDTVPQGWLPCNGQILSINTNQALFSLLGTTYGGNGTTTFAVPNLNGQVPVHPNTSNPLVSLGAQVGRESTTLTAAELPSHSHTVIADGNPATLRTPVSNTWGAQANAYGNTLNAALNATAITYTGGGQPHTNMQPYLALNFYICVQGIYPSRQ